ncbi:putative secreted protein (Por secretion system target) [Chryseobacterium sp. 52]|uniref:fibronectin type III domain-containing protein n=1 Tax=Chryseobacterium sp. 52 TaxID=2035213 RepID=UPI000C17C3FF|nr:fibronectin type III domain-containing protein [Chryseobacterium sp. 52]PIF44795.1 putative secreted protein (Por secretion system target) [Chryseobacterium sp. 52]
MNKFLLIIMVFLAFVAKVSAQCTAVPVPFSQSFSTGALPACWVNQNPTTTSTNANVKWKFTGSAGYGATNNGGRPAGTFAWVDASTPYTNEHNVELLSPQINLSGLTTPYVKFEWFKNHLTSLTGTVPNYEHNQLKLEINSGAGWVQIWAGNTNDPEWRTVGIPLAASYVGATIQLKFTVDKDVLGNGYLYDDVLLDEVQVIQAPTCFEPTTLPATNVTPNSGTINWTPPLSPAPAPAIGYEYYYTTTNTPPVAATTGTSTSGTTANLTPLVAGTTYYWWVRSVCSPTDKTPWVAGTPFTPGQIGGGSSTHAYLPVYSCSGFNYSQQIYTAAEVAGAVGTNTYITSVKFYVSTVGTTQANYNQWVVYMGNTAQSDFGSTTSWVPFSSLTQTYSGTLPAMTAGTWVTIPLTTPFLWDGTSNLVIAVDENVTGTSCTANWGSYSAGTNKGMLYYSTTTNPNPVNPPTATNRYSVIPMIQMTGTALAACVNTPPTNIAVGNVSATSANVSWTPVAGATYILRYRSLPGGAWTTVNLTTPLTNTYTIDNLLEFTQYEVEVATVCGTNTAGVFSAPVSFTTPGVSWCPHAAQYTSATYGWISNVTVNPVGSTSLNNTSLQSQYTDYSANPALALTLARNTQNNSISVGKTWTGTQYANYTNVWIDFDRNGIFDTSELVYTSGSNATSPVTGTFSVPAVTYNGPNSTRMRVVVSYAAAAGACSGNTYGEVEDYAVKFIDLQPCSTTAPLPTVSGMTSNTAYVSWIPTANATYRIRWRQQGTASWVQPTAPLGYLELPAGQSFYTITGLLEQTSYEVQIQAKCGTIWGAFGATVNFTTPSLTYCNMTGTGTNDYISNVKVTPVNFPLMDNTSLQTNYISYNSPATLINLEIGSSGNQLSVSKSWLTTTYADAVDVYIDWNRDGIFAATEKIMTSASSTTTPVTTTFSVPGTGVYTGPYTTTMRVILKRASASVMCVDPVNGEVEDYAVKLRPCSNATPTNVTINPITHNSATINWTAAANNNSFLLEYREVTNPVSAWTVINASALAGNPPVVINGLTPATTYEVRIAAVCGSGGAGAYTPIKIFTTRCDPTPPNVIISNVTSTSAIVTWNPIVPSATYIIRYRPVGSATWISVPAPALPANSITLTGLSSYVMYEVQVANICAGETTPNPWSNPQVFTTIRVCEILPPGLTITTLTPASAEVVWDAYTGTGATNQYILRYRKVGIPSWTTVMVNTNTYTITGLLELTKYEMQVANVCTGTPGNFTPPYYFTAPTVVYCTMTAANSATEFISKVTATPTGKPQMINITPASNYSDFTGTPSTLIEMIQGSNGNQITIDKTLSNGDKAGVAVWIDFNRNGYFDINERILADGSNTNPTASAAFSVPADAFVSMTDYKYVVMRVAMQKDGIPVNCTNFANGEVEDYTVRISKVPVINSLNQNDIMIYPNPVRNILNVKNISAKADYKIYNAAGQLLSTGLIMNNAIDVSSLINGLYIIDIVDIKGSVQKKFLKE